MLTSHLVDQVPGAREDPGGPRESGAARGPPAGGVKWRTFFAVHTEKCRGQVKNVSALLRGRHIRDSPFSEVDTGSRVE